MPTQDDKLDRQLAGAAMAKIKAGKTPSGSERAALKRIERAAEERRRQEYYRTVPQKHYRELSGRQLKVLQEQAARYGIPVDGAVVDLSKVLRGFHDLLAKFGKSILAAEDPMLAGPDSPALEEYRKHRARIAKVEADEAEKSHVSIAAIDERLIRFTDVLRRMGEALQRSFGPDAARLYNEAIDEAIAQWTASAPATETAG